MISTISGTPTSSCGLKEAEVLEEVELAQVDESPGSMVARPRAVGQEESKLVHQVHLN